MESKRKGPLEDLTVIDCTRALAGPFGAGLLADMGARVIKVEPPSGDGYRNIPPFCQIMQSRMKSRVRNGFWCPFAR